MDRAGVESDWVSRIDSTDGRYTDKGTSLRSSPPLTSTGELMSNSLVLNPERFLEAPRFETSLPLRVLKSGKMGVEGMHGDADALRACRTRRGDRKPSIGACVADRGVQVGGNRLACESCSSPLREEVRDLGGAGGTGVRYLSLGLRVKAPVISERLRLCASVGTSRTLRRWPGSKGQKVVDSSAGL